MKSFVRLRKSAKHVDSSLNSIILETMTPPEYTTKKKHWQIQHRDLSHGARLYHYWFIIADNLSSLENAKDCLAFEERDSHSSSEEFRIVRVETSIKEFVETV
jgi:hypothetical protein